ncbi:MAG TPA: hypothetical protein QKA08_00935 [Candidatus Megaira endosymbiont of Nemacystus decipiens]|nr:hypothetical protein [Candidatus Megaera endosymbiont of Nemacystus decipiens]
MRENSNDSNSKQGIITKSQDGNLPKNNLDDLEKTITGAINTKNNEQSDEKSSNDGLVLDKKTENKNNNSLDSENLEKKQIFNDDLGVKKSPGIITNIKSGIVSIFSYIIGPALGIFTSRNNKKNIEEDKEDNVPNDNLNNSEDNSVLSGEENDPTEA